METRRNRTSWPGGRDATGEAGGPEERPSLDQMIHETLEKVCMRNRRQIFSLSERFALILESCEWTGRQRELERVLDYAVKTAPGTRLTAVYLPKWFEKDFVECRALLE